MTLQTANFVKSYEEFFNKSEKISPYSELVLFIAFLKQVSLAPSKPTQNHIVKIIKDKTLLSDEAKSLFCELYVTNTIDNFISTNKLKLDFTTRYYQRIINDIMLESLDFEHIEDLFIKTNKKMNLELVLSNLIISFLRNHGKTDEIKSGKQKKIIYSLLDKYKISSTDEDMNNFLEILCLKVKSEMNGRENKRNKTRETLEIVNYINLNYLESRADVFISSSAITYTKAHLRELLNTSFSNNKKVLYKLLWNYLGRNLAYNSQISLVVEKLKTEPDFLEQLKLNTPAKAVFNLATMSAIEKLVLAEKILASSDINCTNNKNKLKI